jgi:glycosyltransferase involved in cell wall biosynthesis
MPLFSIITISYNNCRGLKETLDSVRAQSCNSFEYIVIDGGSEDGSKELLETYKEKITYWVSEKDSGIYNAMNKGISMAKGTYCLFLNSGDCLSGPDILGKVKACNFKEDILYGELTFKYPDGKRRHAKVPDKITLPYLFADNIWHPSTFIRRELFDSLGKYNETYRIAADYEFFFHALVVKEVSSKPIHFPISIHLADGLSSLPESREAVNAERNRVHHSYLSPAVIDSLTQLSVLNNSGAVKIGRWLDQRPGLKKIMSFFYNLKK